MESSTNKTTMLHADKESGCQTSALNQRRDARTGPSQWSLKKNNNFISNNSTALQGIHHLNDFQFCNTMTAELEREQSRKK